MNHCIAFAFVCFIAGCGPRPVETRPAANEGPIRQAPPGGASADQTLPPAPTFASPPTAPVALDIRLAADSLADEVALDSLQDAAPAESVPELALDAPTWDLNVASFADHPRVRYYIEFFSARSRDRFQVWLDRMPRYEGYARARLTERDLPGDLVYLALIESGFSSVAVSRASAVGMWQFMVPTARGYGLRVDGWVDERRDPIRATDAAARHLHDLTTRFGSHYLAAAAYNGGAGRVGRGLSRMGVGDLNAPLDLSSDDAFFELADTRLIYQETKDYVPKLIAAALIAKEPTRYGFRAPAPSSPFPLDSVVVDGGTGLDLIARLADTPLDALRELNPHLLRLVTPPGRSYSVRLPANRAESVTRRYAAVPEAERRAIASHTVRKGETVANLASRYGVSASLIRSANASARGKRLRVGTTLYIPVSRALPEAMLREREAVVATSVRTHTVRRGETLGRIAERYGVPQASLRVLNKLSTRSTIRVGQKLVIKRVRGGSPTKLAVANASRRTHVVKRGETVGGIAERYGVRSSALISANGLGRRGVIRAGQRLRIPV